MRADRAAWVRENVWPSSWLRSFNDLPSPFLNSACQRPPSVECQMDRHSACRHDEHPMNETVIATSARRAARFPDPYEHRTPAGRHGRRLAHGPNDVAWVWPAGDPCREVCPCPCHRPGAVSAPAEAVPVQLGLFAGVTR